MIYLQNSGELDLRAMRIMGLHGKDCDNPIGYFGTGLKYAIAVCLREGIEASIFIGTNRYIFDAQEIEFRGQSKSLCTMIGPSDSIELPFTTDLGRDWETWQAYRELHSNCLDEGGVISTEYLSPVEGSTTLHIGMDIDPSTIFLDTGNKNLLYSDDQVEIYEGSSATIFYRGIRAKDLENVSEYTYNILGHCTLTEDRSLSYDFQIQEIIGRAVAMMDNTDIIESVVTAPQGSYEYNLNMESNVYQNPSETYREIAESRPQITSRTRDYLEKYRPVEPVKRSREDLIEALQMKLNNALADSDEDLFPNIKWMFSRPYENELTLHIVGLDDD